MIQCSAKPNDRVQKALKAETSTLQRYSIVLWPLKHTLSLSAPRLWHFFPRRRFSAHDELPPCDFSVSRPPSPNPASPALRIASRFPLCACSERIVRVREHRVIGVWPILRTAEHVHGRDVSTYLPTPRGIELPPRAPMWQLSYLTYRLGNCIDTFFFNGASRKRGAQASAVIQAARPSRLVWIRTIICVCVCVCVCAPLTELVDSSRSELVRWLRQEAGLETRG